MSIYATWFFLNDEVPSEDPDSRAPIFYQGSHILPTDGDPRDGSVDVAAIPGFVTRDGRALYDEDDDGAEETVWPWLRLSVNDQIVILDRRQVLGLYHVLGDWMVRCPGGEA